MGSIMFYCVYIVLQCIKDIHCCTEKKILLLAVANVRLPWIPLVCKIQLQIHVSETKLSAWNLSQWPITEDFRADGLNILSLC